MAEATGCKKHRRYTVFWKCQEIRMMIGQSGGFQRNAENPLGSRCLVIIDEMSMVDLPLMYALLNAIVPEHVAILVGDVNQLPSVG